MVISMVTQIWEPQKDALSHTFPSQHVTDSQQQESLPRRPDLWMLQPCPVQTPPGEHRTAQSSEDTFSAWNLLCVSHKYR